MASQATDTRKGGDIPRGITERKGNLSMASGAPARVLAPPSQGCGNHPQRRKDLGQMKRLIDLAFLLKGVAEVLPQILKERLS